jgi:hypothetical protein
MINKKNALVFNQTCIKEKLLLNYTNFLINNSAGFKIM